MSRKVRCGNVDIGGGSPVSIQSMLNVRTSDIPAALRQIEELAGAGCDIVRLAVADFEDAEALGKIKRELLLRGGDRSVPLVADVHFDYRLAVESIKNGADKVRINPGNIGGTGSVKAVVEAAKERGIPIRIGVNSGSLEKDILEKHGGVTAAGLAESALRNIRMIEEMDYRNIVVSVKSSDIQTNIGAHRKLAAQIEYPFHIGITESGTPESGMIKSAIGIGSLLLDGIGDTIRVSLTGDPVKEVLCAKGILEAVGIRAGGIDIISCPTCGRTAVNIEKIAYELTAKLAPLKYKRENEGKKRISVAVMGCAVNGPGEAKEADFGVACGEGRGAIFVKGEIVATVPENRIIDELMDRIENGSDH